MTNQKVIVVSSKNRTPQQELDEALAELGNNWVIVSASTSLAPWGSLTHNPEIVEGSALHMYYVTTAILHRCTCNKCGGKVEAQDNFCIRCGTKF
jgi:hypothetical protein